MTLCREHETTRKCRLCSVLSERITKREKKIADLHEEKKEN